MAVCGEAANISSAMRGITASNPHVAIIGLFFEDGSGFELIEKIGLRFPRTAVLVLSMHDEAYYADRVLRAGVRGYVCKKEPTRRIIAALRCILQGKVYLSPSSVQRLIGNHASVSTSKEAQSVKRLSDREIEVFAMIGRGLGPVGSPTCCMSAPRQFTPIAPASRRNCSCGTGMNCCARRSVGWRRPRNIRPNLTKLSIEPYLASLTYLSGPQSGEGVARRGKIRSEPQRQFVMLDSLRHPVLFLFEHSPAKSYCPASPTTRRPAPVCGSA